jgi:RNA polymerase sigma factor (sigma-70 family)
VSSADDEVTVLFQKESGHLRGYLINIGASPDLADDLVNDAFLAIHRKWAKLRDTNAMAYGYTVARNQLWSELKRRRDESVIDAPMDSFPDVISDPTTRLDQETDEAAVRRALARMPFGRQKEAVVLRHISALSVADTASIMKTSTGAVKGYTHHGLRKLRALLEGDGDREGESR